MVPESDGDLRRISIVGVLARYATESMEAVGAVGATLQLMNGQEITFRQDLLNGRHYRDALLGEAWPLNPGDGTSLQPLGAVDVEGQTFRVERLIVDIPIGIVGDRIRFRDLGSPSSFMVFDLFFEFEPVGGCPFRTTSGGVALAELPPVIRVGDRVRFNRALEQLLNAIEAGRDLDEARGQALTFVAIVLAGSLELGGTREMHRVQLDTARELDFCKSLPEVVRVTRQVVDKLAMPLFGPKAGPSARLVDRALTIVERNYAKNLTDTTVAEQLGLSTSHFRYLFKQATGQAFHKYLISVRLEKAKRMLQDENIPVSQVAAAVGFSGLAHFSRAFSQRFAASPSNVRRITG
jgi:AraC-like DNA-binding protein